MALTASTRKQPTRVGEMGAIVKPGDRVPGKPGHYYEAGQIAPSAMRLTAIKLQEMEQAGLLPHVPLDIYDDDTGEISQSKLEKLDLQTSLQPYGIANVEPDIPPFVVVGLSSVLNVVDPEIFDYVPITNVGWVADPSPSGGEEQILHFSEITDVTMRNILTGFSRVGESFYFVVYQPYFVYLSVPIVPAVKNISVGLNVSSVSTLKTLGYMLFEKLRISDKRMFEKVIESIGWSHVSSISRTEMGRYFPAGAEIGAKGNSSWFRSKMIPAVSASATLSPRETFSEVFMNYYVHRMYLAAKSKNYVEVMEDIVEYAGER